MRQRCPLSPLLFNLYIKKVGRKIEGSEYGVIYMVMNEKEEIVYKCCAGFLYADDIVLLSNNEGELQLLIDEVRVWKIGDGVLEETDKYKYLGVVAIGGINRDFRSLGEGMKDAKSNGERSK